MSGVSLDFLAEVADIDPEVFSFVAVLWSPDMLEEFFVKENAPSISSHEGEKTIFRRRELDFTVANSGAMAYEINGQVTRRKGRMGAELLLLLGTTEDSTDACNELTRVEGFGNVVIDADVEAFEDIALLTFCCKHHDRDLREFADTAGDFKAIHHRHHDIEDNKVGVFAFDRFKGERPIRGRNDTKVFVFEIGFDEAHKPRLIIDNEDERSRRRLYRCAHAEDFTRLARSSGTT